MDVTKTLKLKDVAEEDITNFLPSNDDEEIEE